MLRDSILVLLVAVRGRSDSADPRTVDQLANYQAAGSVEAEVFEAEVFSKPLT